MRLLSITAVLLSGCAKKEEGVIPPPVAPLGPASAERMAPDDPLWDDDFEAALDAELFWLGNDEARAYQHEKIQHV